MLPSLRELRNGVTSDGKTKIKSPTGTLSTAEAISVLGNGLALAAHFGDGGLSAHDLAAGLVGAVVKDPVQDQVSGEYLETVVKEARWLEGSVSGLPGTGDEPSLEYAIMGRGRHVRF